jgi:hypothetical protein
MAGIISLPDDLQEKVAATGARLRAGYPFWLRPFLSRQIVAITLGRRIYILPSYLERPQVEVARLIRHELAHVAQVQRHGLLRFLAMYVAEFARHLRRERSFDAAYHRISFEVEARQAEEA